MLILVSSSFSFVARGIFSPLNFAVEKDNAGVTSQVCLLGWKLETILGTGFPLISEGTIWVSTNQVLIILSFFIRMFETMSGKTLLALDIASSDPGQLNTLMQVAWVVTEGTDAFRSNNSGT